MTGPDGDGSVLTEDGARVFDEARALFATSHWRRCVELLTEADARSGLHAEGLLLLGQSAQLVGADEQAATVFARAYQAFLDDGDLRAATHSAMSNALVLENAAEPVRSRAWAARAQRLVEDHDLGGAESGWVLSYQAHLDLAAGRVDEALLGAREGERLALAAHDANGLVLCRLTIGFALLIRGERTEAIDVFDEIMLAVSSDETSPVMVGLCYCLSIAACMAVRDVVRARAWTTTLDRWCAARPDLVAYRGTCLVHRAQMSTLGGNWTGALAAAADAEGLLVGTAAGQAAYQLGELHRLMGSDVDAEDAYRRANALGFQPEPGLSRLRLAQGRPEVAARTLRRLCAEPRPPADRAELLAALVDAELDLGDVEGARRSAGELRNAAEGLASPLLLGLADRAEGAVLLAEDRPADALDALRRAQQRWTELDLPHPCAQVRVLAGRCLQAMGDEDSAALEFEAARECFERLGAASDLARVPSPGGPVARPGGLTVREIEVVRLVAAGHTNRAIAGQLFLSEKTVARHLANIYAKLDVPSRAAATAYAYANKLV